MDMAIGDTSKSKTGKLILSLGLGAIAGFFGAMGFMRLIDSGALGEFTTSQEIAGLVGLIYILTTLAVIVGLISPALGARFLNVEDADELREQRLMLGWSALGMIAMGVALVLAAIGAPGGPIAPSVTLVAVILLVAIGWFAGLRQRRHTDELMTSVTKEATCFAFYLTFLLGGGWALLAHVEYTAAPQPLDWLTMFAGFLLIASFIAAGKRGMLVQR